MKISSDTEGNGKRSGSVEVRIEAGIDELSRVAAMEFLRQSRQAVKKKGLFTLALSGGSTPRSLYSLLATDPSLRSEVPWDQTHFFWGDERHVPPGHPESNYRMAKETIFSKVAVPTENIHRIRTEETNAHQAAEKYEDVVRTFFRLKAGEFPCFDLVLLGMGTDGHTASLFPGTAGLREQRRLVVANWVERFNAYRITMTLPVFNEAAFVLFLVSGEEKAETLHRVLEERDPKEPLPSQLIRPTHGRLLWLADRPAGRLLKTAPHLPDQFLDTPDEA